MNNHIQQSIPPAADTRHPRTLPAQLVGTVNGGARTTPISQHITFPYTIRHITIAFPPGCDNLVQATPLVCLDDSQPTTALPPGTALLAQISPTIYVVGDDNVLQLPLNHRVETIGTWLKLHLYNTDIQPHTVTALIAIEELLPEDL